MTFRGRVHNGVVVFETSPPFADRTVVEVAPASQPNDSGSRASAEPSWAEVLIDVIGKAEGLPSDMARNHNHYIHGSPKR
jgi:hypothetical protein